MDKDSIYRLIGYQGEYTENVKKAIRKLLKDNHPDHKGNQKIFEIINEVKKELEENRVSYKIQETVKNEYDDIDYNYCEEMISKLEKERKKSKHIIKEKQDVISKINSNYKKKYQSSLQKYPLEENTKYTNKVLFVMMFLICTICLIFIFLFDNIYFLILFIIVSIITIYAVYDYVNRLKKMSIQNKAALDNYLNIIEDLNDLVNQKQSLSDEIIIMERKLKTIENDLRFYNNLLKYK